MQEPLTSLVSQLISGLPASSAGKSSATPAKGEGAFLKVLSMLSDRAAGRNAVSLTGDGKQTPGGSASLADLLPTLLSSDITDLVRKLQTIASMEAGGIDKASLPTTNSSLLTSDINDLAQSLQTTASMEAGGTDKASLPTANSSTLSGDGGPAQKAGQSVETFLSALMTLFGSGGIVANGGGGANDNATSGSGVEAAVAEALTSIGNPGSASGINGETTKGADEAKKPSGRPVNHEESTGDTGNALQVLAVLVFNSLAAVLQGQPQEALSAQGSAGTTGVPSGESQADAVLGAPGRETIYRTLVDLERLCNGALLEHPVGPGQRTRSTSCWRGRRQQGGVHSLSGNRCSLHGSSANREPESASDDCAPSGPSWRGG